MVAEKLRPKGRSSSRPASQQRIRLGKAAEASLSPPSPSATSGYLSAQICLHASRRLRFKEPILSPTLLTFYILSGPVVVAGVLFVLVRAFFREWRKARDEGRSLI